MNKTLTIETRDDAAADETLIAFAEEGAAANLGEWMRRCPDQSLELARLSADRWAGSASAELHSDGAVLRIREIARAAAAAVRPSLAMPRPAASPLSDLLAAAQARGLDARSAAAALDVPFTVFMKLHRRLIAPDLVPQTLLRKMAETFERAEDDIRAFLSRPPALAVGASFRADSAPQTGAQETFADALSAAPDADPAQRAHWESVIASPIAGEDK